jgi:hypothetical protein
VTCVTCAVPPRPRLSLALSPSLAFALAGSLPHSLAHSPGRDQVKPQFHLVEELRKQHKAALTMQSQWRVRRRPRCNLVPAVSTPTLYSSATLCRETWARVTIEKFRPLARHTHLGGPRRPFTTPSSRPSAALHHPLRPQVKKRLVPAAPTPTGLMAVSGGAPQAGGSRVFLTPWASSKSAIRRHIPCSPSVGPP